MFRASSAHLQEDTVVYMQHMVLSLSMRVSGGLSVHSLSENDVYRQATTNSYREWQYQMLHVNNCILLKMSTWCSEPVEEYNILWINNNQCIKLVINVYIFPTAGRVPTHPPPSLPSLSVRVVYCQPPWWPVGTQLKQCTDRSPGTPVESDITIGCMCIAVSSWRWALEAGNM